MALVGISRGCPTVRTLEPSQTLPQGDGGEIPPLPAAEVMLLAAPGLGIVFARLITYAQFEHKDNLFSNSTNGFGRFAKLISRPAVAATSA
jgi:hypothetical protein